MLYCNGNPLRSYARRVVYLFNTIVLRAVAARTVCVSVASVRKGNGADAELFHNKHTHIRTALRSL